METYLIYETPGNELMLDGIVYLHSQQLLLGQVTVTSQTSKAVVLLSDSSPFREERFPGTDSFFVMP